MRETETRPAAYNTVLRMKFLTFVKEEKCEFVGDYLVMDYSTFGVLVSNSGRKRMCVGLIQKSNVCSWY